MARYPTLACGLLRKQRTRFTREVKVDRGALTHGVLGDTKKIRMGTHALRGTVIAFLAARSTMQPKYSPPRACPAVDLARGVGGFSAVALSPRLRTQMNPES